MKKLLSLLLFLTGIQSAWSQGFERPIYDWTTRIWKIIPMDEDRIEVVAWEGHTQTYYIEQDSLGPKRPHQSATITNFGSWYFSHSFNWGPQQRVYYENSTDGKLGRYALNLGLYNLDDFSDYKRISPPYFSPSFNPILVNDTLFAYRGEPMDYRHNLVFTANDTLIRYYFDWANDTIHFLDTLILPFVPQFPGNLHYLPQTKQNVLVLDSLEVYISPGQSRPDSILKIPPYSREVRAPGYNQHYYLTKASPYGIKRKRRVFDTLGAHAVDLYRDQLGFEAQVLYPSLGPTNAAHSILKLEEDSSLTMGFFNDAGNWRHSGIHLYRVEHGELVKSAYYAAPEELKRVRFNTIASDSAGNFYIGLSYWYQDQGCFHCYQPMLVKLDSTNLSRPLLPVQQADFEVYHFKNAPGQGSSVFFVLPNQQDAASYQINDIQGRVFAEGRARSRETIDLGAIKAGTYYLSLWLGGNYLGTKAMVVYGF